MSVLRALIVLMLSSVVAATQDDVSSALVRQAPFRASVSTVAVFATVVDDDGRLVPDLTRDDFTVLDDGRRADITLFSNERQPITVAVMLDMSGSMIERFSRIRSSTREFINALLPEDRAQIGTFGEEVAISPLLTGDKAILVRVLEEELWPGGGTPLWTALVAGMDALSAEKGRRVVLTITDGGDVCTLRRCASFIDAQQRAVREGFMIYAIGIERPGLGGQIIRLAKETGGGHFEIKGDDDLTSTFMRVAEELRQQYMIGFEPSALDGELHPIEVKVRHEGMKVRARRNYLAVRFK